MQWQQLLCAERLTRRPAKSEPGRSPFISDHDKIIFSGAFRRLARKTQVHPLASNDHVHNRMTHSLEVACVGRSLAIRVAQELKQNGSLPDNILPTDVGDIVQSSCLAHDIGNPPFGHTGEEAIRHWFDKQGREFLQDLTEKQRNDLLFFEGNAQGLRILTTTEYHQHHGGMRLTYATLASFIKYPWGVEAMSSECRPKANKYGIYQADYINMAEIAEKTGLIKRGENWFCRHPLVYLMEAADDFCYGLIDLEDGLEMGLIRWHEIMEILRPVLPEKEWLAIEQQLQSLSDGRKPAFIRGKIIDAYIEAGVNAFIDHEKAFLQGEVTGDLIELCDSHIQKTVSQAKQFAKERIFANPRKLELEIGAYDVIGRLLAKLVPAAVSWYKGETSREVCMLMDLVGPKNIPQQADLYQVLMAVVDFVSGMTDNYAVYLSKQFAGMGGAQR